MYDPTNSRYRYIELKGDGYNRRFVQHGKSLKQADTTAPNIQTPAHGSYGALMFTKEWRKKRQEILERDGHTCVVCSVQAGLQVHHRQYHFVVRQNQFKLPWDYPEHLLITLCESCHKRGHNKFKVPTINI